MGLIVWSKFLSYLTKNININFMEILRELAAAEFCKCDLQREVFGAVGVLTESSRIESN